MKKVMQKTLLLVLFNCCAIGLYIYLASKIWPHEGEEGIPGGPGDGIYWMLSAGPLMVITILLNFICLIPMSLSAYRLKEFKALAVWGLIMLCWFGVFRYDQFRHYSTPITGF